MQTLLLSLWSQQQQKTRTRISCTYGPHIPILFQFVICLEEKTTLESLNINIDGELIQFVGGSIKNPSDNDIKPPYCLGFGGFCGNTEQCFLQSICSAKKVFLILEIDKEKINIPFTKEQIAGLINVYAMIKADFNGL